MKKRSTVGVLAIWMAVAYVEVAVSASTEDIATFDLPGGAAIEMVWIEPGTFVMGSPIGELDRDNDETQHEVTISRGFWLGKYELTQGEWESGMDTTPWSGEGLVVEDPNHPAVYISWDDAQALIAKLNQTESVDVYRLPTEAEWEYACRAGTTTRWSFGEDLNKLGEYAWHHGNTRVVTVDEMYAHPVGTKLPNPWGLYDMHGNVWEWVQDFKGPYPTDPQTDPAGPAWSSNGHIVRGGAWAPFGYPRYLRSANRVSEGGLSVERSYGIGVRVVRMEGSSTSVGASTWGQIKRLSK